MFRITLRQAKSLVCPSVFIEICNEGTCVISVHASGGEYYPASVAAPCVIRVHIIAVGFGKCIATVCLQVLYPQVAAFVPNMELPVIAFCIQDIASVRTYSVESYALSLCFGIYDNLRNTESIALGIVWHAPQIIVYLIVIGRNDRGAKTVRNIFQLWFICRTEIMAVTGRRPAGKCLQLIRVEYDSNLDFISVIQY